MNEVAPIVPRGAHCTSVLLVHLVWATRHRAPTLEPCVDGWLAALFERKARRIDCRALAAGCADDHVHVLVQYPARVSVATIAHRLKGASSRELHRLPAPTPVVDWQVGYWAESVSPRDLDALTHYIRRQRAHHREHPSRERWETLAP